MSRRDGAASGRVVIVTGGGSGIGRGLSLSLARRGDRLVVADLRRDSAEAAAATIAAAGGKAEAREVDVTLPASVDQLVDGAVAAHGRVDLMVNNAGVAIAGEFRDVPADAFRRVVEVDFFGVVNGSRAAYRHMAPRGSGHIVNIASMYGLLPGPSNSPYVAAKHAVVGFSESLRVEAADLGVTVTTVCPGFIDTPLLSESPAVGVTMAEAMRLVPFALVPLERAVALIVQGIEEQAPLVVFPRYVKLLLALQRTLPAAAFRLQRELMRTFRALRRA